MLCSAPALVLALALAIAIPGSHVRAVKHHIITLVNFHIVHFFVFFCLFYQFVIVVKITIHFNLWAWWEGYRFICGFELNKAHSILCSRKYLVSRTTLFTLTLLEFFFSALLFAFPFFYFVETEFYLKFQSTVCTPLCIQQRGIISCAAHVIYLFFIIFLFQKPW